MWCRGEADSPYGELMTYVGEVGNGGHTQYFTNTALLKADMEVLDAALPPVLRDNLRCAFDAFQNDGEEILAHCDRVFGENEHLITAILKTYADTL